MKTKKPKCEKHGIRLLKVGRQRDKGKWLWVLSCPICENEESERSEDREGVPGNDSDPTTSEENAKRGGTSE